MTDGMYEAIKEQQELRRREQEYDRQQQERRELREIEAKRAELDQHLKRRGVDYLEHTGQQPPRSLVQRWQAEFVDAKEIEREAERQTRFDEAHASGPYS
jgi:hypothetical protein